MERHPASTVFFEKGNGCLRISPAFHHDIMEVATERSLDRKLEFGGNIDECTKRPEDTTQLATMGCGEHGSRRTGKKLAFECPRQRVETCARQDQLTLQFTHDVRLPLELRARLPQQRGTALDLQLCLGELFGQFSLACRERHQLAFSSSTLTSPLDRSGTQLREFLTSRLGRRRQCHALTREALTLALALGELTLKLFEVTAKLCGAACAFSCGSLGSLERRLYCSEFVICRSVQGCDALELLLQSNGLMVSADRVTVK